MEAPKRHRNPRILERLGRDQNQLRRTQATNDYLSTTVSANNVDRLRDSSILQRLNEPLLRDIFSKWREVIETKHYSTAEISFMSSRLFDTVDHEHGMSPEAIERARDLLRKEFESQFLWDSERQQLAASVSQTEKRFDSAVSLSNFVSIVWDALIGTSAFDENGTSIGAAKANIKVESVVQVLMKGVTRSKPRTSGNDLADYASDIFSSIDNQQRGTITWGQFVSYVIENAYNHSLSGKAQPALRMDSRAANSTANGSVIYKDSFSVKYPAHRQHWCQNVFYFDQGGWESVVALDGRHAVVSLIEDFEKQHGVFDGDTYAEEFDENDDFAASLKREALEERLRVSGASHISKGVHYFGHQGIVNGCEWISKENLFLTVATEQRQLRFWGVHNRSEFRFLNHLRVNVSDGSAITCVKIDEKRLLSSDTIKIAFGTRSGQVLHGDIVDADSVKRCHKFTTTEHWLHTDTVTDMLVLPRSQRIVSCGLDGKIFGFLPGHDALRTSTEYRGHERGILCMSYCSGYEVFVSGGFEYSAFCWAENLPRSPAFKLEDAVQPHQHPICSVMAVARTPTVYTVDTSGVIKLFDVRTFKVLGSWGAFDVGRVPTHVIHELLLAEPATASGLHSGRAVASACFTGAKRRSIFLSARSLHRFLTESRNGDADRPLDLSEPIISLSVGTSTFLTASSRVLRVWSQSSGTIIATHQAIRYSNCAVSCAVVDDIATKIVCGHGDGQISVFQRDSGALMRRYKFHDCRIFFIHLDLLHGVIVSSCGRGQVSFWRDEDVSTSWRGRSVHFPVNDEHTDGVDSFRKWGPLPREFDDFLTYDAPKSLHVMSFQRWVINRWKSFVEARKNKRQSSTVVETVKSVRTPFAVLRSMHVSVAFDACVQHARVAILSTKTACRIVTYTTVPPRTTHRLFHGKDRPLLGVALMSSKNLVVVSDSHGLVFVWAIVDNKPAMLLSAVRNRCLVASYTHPHEEFRDADGNDLEVDALPPENIKLSTEDALLNDSLPSYRPPAEAVPVVTAMWFDIHRFVLLTGDDVGFVSVWEVERVFQGCCDVVSALHESIPSGASPRWVLAWRAHALPVIHVRVTRGSYAVVTLGSDNMVSIWTIAGEWIAGLRQGPVVDRAWLFPFPLAVKASIIRYRFEKLYQAFKEGELARLRRVRDAEELDAPIVSVDLLRIARGETSLGQVDAVSVIRVSEETKTKVVHRANAFLALRRVSTRCGSHALARRRISSISALQPSAPIDSDDERTDINFGPVVDELHVADPLSSPKRHAHPISKLARVSPAPQVAKVVVPQIVQRTRSVEPLRRVIDGDPRGVVPTALSNRTTSATGHRLTHTTAPMQNRCLSAFVGPISLGGIRAATTMVQSQPWQKDVRVRPETKPSCGDEVRRYEPCTEPSRHSKLHQKSTLFAPPKSVVDMVGLRSRQPLHQ